MPPSLKKKWPFSKNENEPAPLSATWAAGALRSLSPPYFCPMLCGKPVAEGPGILSCRKTKFGRRRGAKPAASSLRWWSEQRSDFFEFRGRDREREHFVIRLDSSGLGTGFILLFLKCG